MRLRQIALVADHLQPVVDDLCAVLGIRVSFNDPGVGTYGLENAVMPIGDTFLEVVAPVRPDTTAGRYLERRGGNGGYMVILQSEDLDADRARFVELGVRVVAQLDRPHARGTHLHPRDVGGAILSVDDMDPPESWEWAGPNWREAVDTSLVSGITGVAIQGHDAGALADRWAQVLGREVETDGAARDINLEEGGIRFVQALDERGEGVSTVRLATTDPDEVMRRAEARGLLDADGRVVICGTVFDLDG